MNMSLANEEAQTRPYQYYVTVRLSVPPINQFWEAPVVTVQWFVCLNVAMTTSRENGYGTQSISHIPNVAWPLAVQHTAQIIISLSLTSRRD